ncbi:MAG: ribosomal protein large subunit ribosomal protein [Candidatus Parcubacteria bacterium]|jgi:large subunit ribosomal protein L10
MAITREKKEAIFSKIQDVVDKPSVVFVNFKGLPVAKTSEMRAKLASQNISYFVAKKTLVKKAFGEANIAGNMPTLDGELAVAFSEDPTAAPREIFAFSKEFKDSISIVGGVFESRFMNKTEMEEVAKIPSLHVLRGMFVNVINSPIQGFAMVVKAYADKKAA